MKVVPKHSLVCGRFRQSVVLKELYAFATAQKQALFSCVYCLVVSKSHEKL